jgi:hypothetical protein
MIQLAWRFLMFQKDCEWRSGQIPNTATGVGHPEDWGSP